MLDLLGEPHLPAGEGAKDACERRGVRIRERLAARDLPERQEREGEVRVVPGGVPPVDAHVAKVEEHPEVERPLRDVRPDLLLVRAEPLL